MIDPKSTRGYRNNNPGNIERGKDVWRGMAVDQTADSRFIMFDAPHWGIRAIARILQNYRRHAGLATIRQMIETYAPRQENDTDAYVARVAAATGLDPNTDRVDVEAYAPMRALVEAIIRVEIGANPYGDAPIDEGLRLAGIERQAAAPAREAHHA